MTDQLQSLLQQRDQLEQEIAAAKAAAVASVLQTMKDLKLNWSDFGVTPIKPVKPAGFKRPVKYRDDKGNTWTGVGQRPNWLRAAMEAGATLESFAVKAE